VSEEVKGESKGEYYFVVGDETTEESADGNAASSPSLPRETPCNSSQPARTFPPPLNFKTLKKLRFPSLILNVEHFLADRTYEVNGTNDGWSFTEDDETIIPGKYCIRVLAIVLFC